MKNRNWIQFFVLCVCVLTLTLGVCTHNENHAYGADLKMRPLASEWEGNPLYDYVQTNTAVSEDYFQEYAPLLMAEESTYSEPIATLGTQDAPVSLEEAGLFLRPYMKARETDKLVFWVRCEYPKVDRKEVVREALKYAYAYTANPTEGDYLRWHYKAWGASFRFGDYGDGTYLYEVTLNLTYHTTAEQEAELDVLVPETLEDLQVAGKSDFEKIAIIYNYITHHVEYDHEHVSDTDYSPQYTAYGALHDHIAICQGYSLLLYRFLLEEGIDCRLIAGNNNANGVPTHGWSIVELEDKWYNMDATWDAETLRYWAYFLKSPEGFQRHTRDVEYESDDWHKTHPMAAMNYAIDETASYDAVELLKAKMDTYGYLYVPCNICNILSCSMELPPLNERTYHVFWDGNGGTLHAEPMRIYYCDNTAFPNVEVSRTGYTLCEWEVSRYSDGKYYAFDENGEPGWYTEEEIGNLGYEYNTWKTGDDISSLSTADGDLITFTAQWKANTYKVSYKANGGTGSMSSHTFTYGTSKALRANAYKKTGYTFKCWYLQRTSDNKWYARKKDGTKGWHSASAIKKYGYTKVVFKNKATLSKITAVNKDTVYACAQWTANTYTLKFKANGGTGSMSSQTFTYGVSKAIKANTFKRKGYTFKGWTAYRPAVKKWYAKKKDGTKGWYSASAIKKYGYTKVVFSNRAKLSKLTSVQKDTVSMYANWKKK